MSLISLDLETVCAMQGCKGFDKADDAVCSHALSPWHNRITVIAAIKEGWYSNVFRSVESFAEWYEGEKRFGPIKLIGHNLKFDLLNLRVRLPDVPALDEWYGDTMLMAYVCTEKIDDRWLAEYKENAKGRKGQRNAGKHSLKTLAPYFLGVEPFWEVEDKDNDDYVLKDAQYTLKLFHYFDKKLKELGQYDFYLNKQLPWTKMLLTAEERGIKIDLDRLNQKERELKAREVELEERLDQLWAKAHEEYRTALLTNLEAKYKEMAERADKPFEAGSRYWKLCEAARAKVPDKINYASPSQMTWLLRDYLGYDITGFEGDESTGKAVLHKLASEGKEDVACYLEWRQISKLLTAFIPTYRDLAADSAIHPQFNPANTRTGRTSSSNPNLQQVPPELRPLFIPRAGYKFVGYDAAAIEARLIALYSDDPVLYMLIKNNISIHDHNTKVFFGLSCDHSEVPVKYKPQRAASKNVGFALFYNAGVNRIRVAFAQKGFMLTDGQCRDLLNRFHASYQVAMAYSRQVVRYFEQGETLENLFGRPIAIPNPEDAYMKGFNTTIQSTASDYNLDVGYRAWQRARELGIDATPLLFVHDFNNFEVKEEQAEVFAKLYTEVATDYRLKTSHGPLPLEVEGGIMDCWEK